MPLKIILQGLAGMAWPRLLMLQVAGFSHDRALQGLVGAVLEEAETSDPKVCSDGWVGGMAGGLSCRFCLSFLRVDQTIPWQTGRGLYSLDCGLAT